MFLIGLIMLLGAVAMVVAAFFAPAVARPGLLGGALGVGLAGLVFVTLDWPSRKRSPGPGMVKADAYVLNARLTNSEVMGNRMVELTLEVRPKDAVPFQVKRKFVGNMPSLEVGKRVAVFYDPIDPRKLELV